MDAVGADALLHRAEQDHLQVAAMDRQLRCVIAGETPARLAEGELAVAIVEAHLLRLDGDRLQRRLQAEVAAFLHRMRQQRSEERRVGKECVSTGRSRGSPYQSK